jgi:hypothetical protein
MSTLSDYESSRRERISPAQIFSLFSFGWSFLQMINFIFIIILEYFWQYYTLVDLWVVGIITIHLDVDIFSPIGKLQFGMIQNSNMNKFMPNSDF